MRPLTQTLSLGERSHCYVGSFGANIRIPNSRPSPGSRQPWDTCPGCFTYWGKTTELLSVGPENKYSPLQGSPSPASGSEVGRPRRLEENPRQVPCEGHGAEVQGGRGRETLQPMTRARALRPLLPAPARCIAAFDRGAANAAGRGPGRAGAQHWRCRDPAARTGRQWPGKRAASGELRNFLSCTD